MASPPCGLTGPPARTRLDVRAAWGSHLPNARWTARMAASTSPDAGHRHDGENAGLTAQRPTSWSSLRHKTAPLPLEHAAHRRPAERRGHPRALWSPSLPLRRRPDQQPGAQRKYEAFGEETGRHVEILERLNLHHGGQASYVSPGARDVEGMDTQLLQSNFLLGGSLDVERRRRKPAGSETPKR